MRWRRLKGFDLAMVYFAAIMNSVMLMACIAIGVMGLMRME